MDCHHNFHFSPLAPLPLNVEQGIFNHAFFVHLPATLTGPYVSYTCVIKLKTPNPL